MVNIVHFVMLVGCFKFLPHFITAISIGIGETKNLLVTKIAANRRISQKQHISGAADQVKGITVGHLALPYGKKSKGFIRVEEKMTIIQMSKTKHCTSGEKKICSEPRCGH